MNNLFFLNSIRVPLTRPPLNLLTHWMGFKCLIHFYMAISSAVMYSDSYADVCVLYKNKNILCENTRILKNIEGQYVSNVTFGGENQTYWKITVPANIGGDVVSIKLEDTAFCVLFSNRQLWCIGILYISDNKIYMENEYDDLFKSYRLVAENVMTLSDIGIPLIWNNYRGIPADLLVKDNYNNCSSESEPFPLWAILTIVGVLSLVLTALGSWYYRRSKQSALVFIQEVPV